MTAVLNGQRICKKGSTLFQEMQPLSAKLGTVMVVSLLKECANLEALERGKQLHCLIIKRSLDVPVYVRSAIVNMYAKCGSLVDAYQVFNKFCDRDVILWTAMITGYAQCGLGRETLTLFNQMQVEGEMPNKFTFVSVFKACATLENLVWGKQAHAVLINCGFETDIFLENAIVDMYAKCGKIEDARDMFDNMHKKDVVSWTAMIVGYTQHGLETKALLLFKEMQERCLKPNHYTFVSILKVCVNLKMLELGRQVHGHIVETGLESDAFVKSTLVDMYVKCESIRDARQVFNKMHRRNLVSWNAIISGYVYEGLGKEAWTLFEEMQEKGVGLNEVTFASILKACACLASLEGGKYIHACIIQRGLELDLFLGSTLVDMYVKCRSLEDAHRVLHTTHKRDVVFWNSLIAGYPREGRGTEALILYNQMEQEGMIADDVTFVIILTACASLAALDVGKQIHSHLITRQVDFNMIVRSSLVDMYAKSGSIGDARQVFDDMRVRDVVAWNTMIAGYAQHGFSKLSLTLFETMERTGIKPNDVTFCCVLSAYTHGGLVEDGWLYFESLIQAYGLTPTEEHYTGIVDLFGRAGRLVEAMNLLNSLAVQPGVKPWMTLLGACGTHGCIEIGQCAFEHIHCLEPGNAGAYVLLSNIYAAIGKVA